MFSFLCTTETLHKTLKEISTSLTAHAFLKVAELLRKYTPIPQTAVTQVICYPANFANECAVQKKKPLFGAGLFI